MASTDLGTLLLRLAADAGQFESDLGRAARISDKRSREIQKNAVAMGHVIGEAFVEITKKFAGLVKQAFTAGDEFAKMSQKVGVSVESLSTLSYAAERSGLNVDQLRQGLSVLAKNASDAAVGTGEARGALASLGISVTDTSGKLKGTEDLLKELANKFSGYQDSAQKAALAQKIFGEAGVQLLPLLNQGAEGIGQLQERARALGLEFDTNTAKQAERFNDLLADAQDLFVGVGRDIANELIAPLSNLAEMYVKAGIEGRNAAGGAKALADALKVVIAVAYTVKAAIEAVVAVIAGFIDVAVQAAKTASVIKDNLDPLKQAARLFGGEVESVTDSVADFTRVLKSAYSASSTGVKDAINGLTDAYAALFIEIDGTTDAIGRPGGQKGNAPALRNLAAEAKNADEKLKALAKDAEILRKSMDELRKMDSEWAKERRRNQQAFEAQLNAFRDEKNILRLVGREREDYIDTLEAERLARLANNGNLEETIELYKKELAQIRELSKQNEVAREFESIWVNASNAVGDAITSALLDGANEGADKLLDVMKQLARDLIRFWIQQKIIIPLQQRIVNSSSPGTSGGFGGGTLGTVATGVAGLGMAYAGWQGAGNGASALSTVASFTSAGATIGSIIPVIGTAIGAAIGAVVGVLVALFRSNKPPDVRFGGSRENTRRVEGEFQTAFGTVYAGSRKIKYQEFIESFQKFDELLKGIVVSFGDGEEQLAAVQSALANWSVDLKGSAATAENILGSRFDAILSAFNEDVQDFVNQASNLEDRIQRLADAAFIEAAAAAGDLLGTFRELGALLDDYQQDNEAIRDTYIRLLASTHQLEMALDAMGVTLDLGREAFIRFATDITESAGGVEQAGQLWGYYFDNFYSETERGQIALDRITRNATTAFEAIGLSVEDFTGSQGLADFRTLFESIMPSLTAEQVTLWLQAAVSLGLLNTATDEYNALIGQTTEVIVTAADEIRRIRDSLGLGTGDGRPGLGQVPGGSLPIPGGNDPRAPDRGDTLPGWLRDILDRIINRGVIDPTPGTPGGTDPIIDQIDRLREAELRWLERLRNLQNSLLLDDQLSTLTPAEMLAEAAAQYGQTFTAALAGDENARNNFDRIAREYLHQARGFYGSTGNYTSIFDRILADIARLTQASPITQTNNAIGAIGAASQGEELRKIREQDEEIAQATIARQETMIAQQSEMIALLQQQLSTMKQSVTKTLARTT